MRTNPLLGFDRGGLRKRAVGGGWALCVGGAAIAGRPEHRQCWGACALSLYLSMLAATELHAHPLCHHVSPPQRRLCRHMRQPTASNFVSDGLIDTAVGRRSVRLNGVFGAVGRDGLAGRAQYCKGHAQSTTCSQGHQTGRSACSLQLPCQDEWRAALLLRRRRTQPRRPREKVVA